MKIWFWVGLAVIVAIPIVRFLLQRLRENYAQKHGTVLYATVISLEPVKVFGKITPAMKINLWVQEPDGGKRQVSVSTRIPEGQTVSPGMMLPIVIDPKDPKRVSPATAESVKRVQLTGSREQRRQMRKQRM
jgi:hypothetical protein